MPTDGVTDQLAIVQRGLRGFLEPSAARNGTTPEPKNDRLVLRRRRAVCVPTLVLCVGGSARRVGLALRRILSETPCGDVEILEFDTDRYEAAESSGGWVDRGFVPLTVWRPSVILSVLEGRFPSLSWLHRAQVHSAIFRGAGQKPLVGALAFWINFTEARDRISAALARLIQLAPPGKTETDAAQVRVVIIASSAGGTGRGVLIPLGLCIRDIIDQRQGSADANIAVEAFVILHSCFQEVLDTAKYERAKANTYALFKELEFLEVHRSRRARLRGGAPGPRRVPAGMVRASGPSAAGGDRALFAASRRRGRRPHRRFERIRRAAAPYGDPCRRLRGRRPWEPASRRGPALSPGARGLGRLAPLDRKRELRAPGAATAGPGGSRARRACGRGLYRLTGRTQCTAYSSEPLSGTFGIALPSPSGPVPPAPEPLAAILTLSDGLERVETTNGDGAPTTGAGPRAAARCLHAAPEFRLVYIAGFPLGAVAV